MIWPDDDAADAAARQLQKKAEYARELELQIALRRARQQEEQQALEALERKLQPAERSPSRWLVDGGGGGGERSPFRFPPQSPRPPTVRAVEHEHDAPSAGEPSGALDAAARESGGLGQQQAAPPHARFRIIDELDQNDRLRERAQQLEWRRLLDEQVRENARLRQQEEQERQRAEADAAQEEMMFLREQQLRAQRRLGLPETPTQPSAAYTFAAAPSPSRPQYEPLSASGHHQQQQRLPTDYRRQDDYEALRTDDRLYGYNDPLRSGRLGFDADAVAMPPPAPARLDFRASAVPTNRGPTLTPPQPPAQQQSFDAALDGSRGLVINEYRSLLTEIRREREELRREKDELRKEKEELRLERALLQLENEKMASLVEAQRRVNEQHLDMQLQHHEGYHPLPSPTTPTREYFRSPPRSVASRRPPVFDFSQLNQVEHSVAALGLGNRGVRETRLADRRPSAISMDDFAVPRNRLTPNVMDSPRLKRLAQVRSRRAAVDEYPDDELNALDQSLVGESVFVALSPDELPLAAASRGPPRITETASPRRGVKPDIGERNELRNSRVIKSRGFYNFENEADAFPKRQQQNRERKSSRKSSSGAKSPAREPRSAEKRRSRNERGYRMREENRGQQPSASPMSSGDAEDHHHQLASSLPPRTASHARGSEQPESEDEEPALSRSLFQVKVLV